MKYIWDLLKEAKGFIFFSTMIFLIGLWFGYQYDHLFRVIIEQMMEQLKEAVEVIGRKNDPLYTALFIFQNNLKAALLMLGIGIVLFFMPLAILFFNALAVGYVLKVTANSGMSPVEMFIYGILPHGILELTAIIIAAGVGTFLGISLLKWMFGTQGLISHLFDSRSNMDQFWAERGKPLFMKKLISVSLLIVALTFVLLGAAFIEGFITPVIIQKFIGI